MKILDWDKKGNAIRLYLGEETLEKWGGDDWNDVPYEHNAERVYPEYIRAFMDFVVPYDYSVLEPSEEWTFNGNSKYSKDDLKARKVPCLVIYKDDGLEKSFFEACADEKSLKIYMGDNLTDEGFVSEHISLCEHCGAMTHTVLTEYLGTTLTCGKCGARKENL